MGLKGRNDFSSGNVMTTMGTAVLVTLLDIMRVNTSRNPSNCAAITRSRGSPAAPITTKFAVSTRDHLASAATPGIIARATTQAEKRQVKVPTGILPP